MTWKLAPPVALLALIGLPACMVGPDYARPDVEVNDAWLEARGPASVATDAVDVEWWKTLEDPMLDSLVAEALSQNLSLRAAGIRVLQSMAERGVAVGDLFPQSQSVNANASRKKNSENPPPATVYKTSYGANFAAYWELDFWGKFRRSIEAADAELDGSLASYDTVAVSLIAEVSLAYVDIRTLQSRLALARENVGIQEKSLAIASARHEAGETSELDTAQTISLLEQTRASVPSFVYQIDQAVYRLGVLLGRPPTDLIERLGVGGEVPNAPARIAVGVPADLLRRRPDVRQAEREAAAASAQVGVAAAELYPSFTLTGTIGYSGNKTSNVFDHESWTGFIGPGVSYPLLNYGRVEDNVRAQDAAFQASIVNYQNAVLSAAAEVESGLSAFIGTRQQVEHLERSVKASQRSVELSTLQYREGETDYSRVIDSLQSLAQVQDELAATKGQVVTNLISTYKALGGGWEVRDGLDIVPEETKREMRERTDWGEMLDPDYTDGKDLGLIERHDPAKEADDAAAE